MLFRSEFMAQKEPAPSPQRVPQQGGPQKPPAGTGVMDPTGAGGGTIGTGMAPPPGAPGFSANTGEGPQA